MNYLKGITVSLKNLSLMGLTVSVAALVTLIFRKSLFAHEPVGITVQALAALLMLWARLTFGRRSFHANAIPTEGGVITTGPYKFFRHPIYASLLYFIWAGILSHLSLLNCLLGLVPIAGLTIRMLAEERLVTEKYPEYSTYASHTKRVIPFIL